MADAQNKGSSRSDLLDAVIAAFLEAEAAGKAPDRQQLLAQHPELADELAAFFADHDRMKALAGAMGPATEETYSLKLDGAEAPTLPPGEMLAPPLGTKVRYFGDYELLEELGRGGMGVVYKARQISLNRVVALKMVLAGQLAGEEDIKRFYTEAEAAAQLDHPGIVPIYEVGQHEGQHYFSMGYVEGQSLAARVAQGPLPPREAAEIVKAVAEAVHYAHQMGVIHRDLKPANILLHKAESGERKADSGKPKAEDLPSAFRSPLSAFTPRITDFGLAKRVTGESGLTATGQILGTPSFMPPEQASGKLAQISPASDVYALGAVLYTLLTGRPPFQAATPLDTVLQVLDQEPVSLRSLNASIPRDLETIALKCLEKDRTHRYATAQDLADELARYLAGEPILARPVSRPERVWRWCKRKPVVASLAAAVIVSLVAGTFISAYFAIQAEERAIDATQARDDATEKLWGDYLAQARAGRLSGRAGRRFDSLDALAKAAAIRPSSELRNEAIACMALADLRPQHQWRMGHDAVGGPDFNSDLRLYACGDRKANITIRSVPDHREVLRLTFPERPETPEGIVSRFSPDDRFLASWYQFKGMPSRLLVWDLKRRAPALQLPGGQFDFSPDSSQIAVGGPDATVRIHEIKTGKELTSIGVRSNAASIRFAPDGRTLAVATHNVVQVCDLKSRGEPKSLVHGGQVLALAWSPRGDRLAAGCRDYLVCVWDVSANRQARTFADQAGVSRVSFSHSGDILAYTCGAGTTHLWDPDTGSNLGSIRGWIGRFAAHDSRLSLGERGAEGIWEVATSPGCRTYVDTHGPKTRIWAADISPDARLLAATTGAGVGIWDLESGREMAYLPLGLNVSSVFDPTGRSLFICGHSGLSRWPIHQDRNGSRLTVRLGPPEFLLPPGSLERVSLQAQGKLLAAVDPIRGETTVLDRDTGATVATFSGTPKGEFVAMSPDGRWVAVGTRSASGVTVWNLQGQKLERNLPVNGPAGVAFSPDGKWLVTSETHEYRFWRVGSWELSRAVPHDPSIPLPVAFTRDGKVLAVISEGHARLIEAASGREYVAFPGALEVMCFSPDDSRLVTRSANHMFQVWDLPRIREDLAAMGLDWDLPPYPPAQDRKLAPIDEVQVLRAEDRYTVPQGGLAELASFIEAVRSFRPRTPQEQANHRATAPEALRQAAASILELEKDKTSIAYRTATLALLEVRAQMIAQASPEEQRQTVADLKAHLAAQGEDREVLRYVDLAKSVVQTLESAGQTELAADACRSFAEALARSKDEPALEAAKQMEGIARRLTLVGKEIELKGAQLDGRPLDWAAYRGKVVLVDFWSTASPDCGAQHVNAKRNYRLYHDRGLEVVGVNLDEDRKKVEEYLKKDALPWTNLHADGAGWKNPLAIHYGIVAVPTMLLVDKDGKVVSTRARGQELDRLLEKLLGPPFCPKGNLVYVDLQPKANWKLTQGRPGLPSSNLAELPKGEQTFGGVGMRIGDSFIQLRSETWPQAPLKVDGIDVRARVARLYILHGAQRCTPGMGVADGATVAQYRVHYEDGSEEVIPVRSREDVFDWWKTAEGWPVSRATVAWTGASAETRKWKGTMSLYLIVWENPQPDKMALSIDFVSAKTPAGPFCVAMTVEEPVAVSGNTSPASAPAGTKAPAATPGKLRPTQPEPASSSKGAKQPPEKDKGTVEIIAHRGASHDAPENTLAAFKLGWEQQADADELDIHLTKDGQIVVIRDDDTKRTTGVSGAVSSWTLEELRTLDAGSWKGVQWKGERLPTLGEALETVPEGKRMFIEIRCGPEVLPALERVLKDSGKKPEQLVVIGFSYETMEEARKVFPQLPIYWLVGYDADNRTGEHPDIETLIRKAKSGGFDGLNLDFKFPISPEFVSKVKEAGLRLYVWTVDDPTVAAGLIKAGVDGITTNRPGWLRSQLK